MGTGYTLQYDRTFYSVTYVTDVSPVPVGTTLFELKIFVETIPADLRMIIGLDEELRFDDFGSSLSRSVAVNESPVRLNISSGTSNSVDGLLSNVTYTGIQITAIPGPFFDDTFRVNVNITIKETPSNCYLSNNIFICI